MTTSPKVPDKSLFRFAIVDLETTGLYPKNDYILEVGILIADWDLKPRAKKRWIAPKDILGPATARMDDYVKEMHTKNGLLAEIAREEPDGYKGDEIEAFVKQHTHGPDHTYLTGSSIHFDRDFLLETEIDLRALFYRRLIDVSTIKTLCRLWTPAAATEPTEEIAKAHRALPDCEATLAELRHYRERLFVAAQTLHDTVDLVSKFG